MAPQRSNGFFAATNDCHNRLVPHAWQWDIKIDDGTLPGYRNPQRRSLGITELGGPVQLKLTSGGEGDAIIAWLKIQRASQTQQPQFEAAIGIGES